MEKSACDNLSCFEVNLNSPSNYGDIVWGLDETVDVIEHKKKLYNNAHIGNDYYRWLLSKVISMSGTAAPVVVNLYGRCGKRVQLPVFLLSQAFPILNEMILQIPLHFLNNTVDIIVSDTDIDVLFLLSNLLTTGFCVHSNSLKDLFANIGQSLSVSKIDNIREAEASHNNSFQNTVENVTFERKINRPLESFHVARMDITCSKKCSNKCSEVVNSWSTEIVNMLGEKFKCERKREVKTKLLEHLKAQRDLGLSDCGFIIHQHEFCLKSFASITGISEYLLGVVLGDLSANIQLYQHHTTGLVKQESAPTIRAISWIKSFAENYGQFSPEQNVTVLAYWLNKKFLFEMYQDETAAPYVSRSTFYTMFKEKFGPYRSDKSLPWIRISKHSTHSVCSQCVALNNFQKHARTESELREAFKRKGFYFIQQ